MGSTGKYTSVKVPMTLVERINLVAEKKGYRTVSEFVIDWTRRGIEANS